MIAEWIIAANDPVRQRLCQKTGLGSLCTDVAGIVFFV